MVEIRPLGDAPREVLGDELGLDPVHQPLEAREVARVERVGAAEGEAHAMQRERIVVPEPVERGERRPAPHVVLCMDFEEGDGRPGGHDLGDVRRPQPDTRTGPDAALSLGHATGSVFHEELRPAWAEGCRPPGARTRRQACKSTRHPGCRA